MTVRRAVRRWRTALILRELEDEIAALAGGQPLRRQLKDLLRKKELVGDLFNQLRLQHTRQAFGRAAAAPHFESAEAVRADLAQLLTVMDRLDQAITPLVLQDGAHFSERWGYLSIAGVNDKSQIQRQIEKCGPLLLHLYSVAACLAAELEPSRAAACDRSVAAACVLRSGHEGTRSTTTARPFWRVRAVFVFTTGLEGEGVCVHVGREPGPLPSFGLRLSCVWWVERGCMHACGLLRARYAAERSARVQVC